MQQQLGILYAPDDVAGCSLGHCCFQPAVQGNSDAGLHSRAFLLQDDGVAEQLQQAADRAQKWKQQCAKLRQELMESQTAAASSEAVLSVGCDFKD